MEAYCAMSARRSKARETGSGWVMRAREAAWRCCATESATRRRAATFSSFVVAGWVVRVGRGAVTGSGEGEGGGVLIGVESGVLLER